MDPLKMAYGVKKPLEDKHEAIMALQAQQKRYYPVTKNGLLDEWGAVINHQQEGFQKERLETELAYRNQQSNYGQILDQEIQVKNFKAQLEQAEKIQEGELLQNSLLARDAHNRAQQEVLANQKRQYGTEAKSIIDQRQQNKNYEKDQELLADQMDLARNMSIQDQINDRIRQNAQAQKDFLLNENENMHKQRLMMMQMEKKSDQADQRAYLNGLGQGYNAQQAYLQQSYEAIKQAEGNYQRTISPLMKEIYAQQLEQVDPNQQMKVQAAANYLSQQSANVNKAQADWLRNQILAKEFEKQEQLKNQRDFENVQTAKIQQVAAVIQNQTFEIQRENKRRYKDELDRQRAQRDALQAYGNMSQAEKHFNRNDLSAYKNYENTNFAMVPGLNNNAFIGRQTHPSPKLQSSQSQGQLDSRQFSPGSPNSKRPRGNVDALNQVNKLKFIQYGATHLGPQIGSIEAPKIYNLQRGAGGILNLDKQPTGRYSPVIQSAANPTYTTINQTEPPGSHVGVNGNFYNENNNDSVQYQPVARGPTNLSVNQPQANKMIRFNDQNIYDRGVIQRQNIQMKAQGHNANGGIGVSYTNVKIGDAYTYQIPKTTNQVYYNQALLNKPYQSPIVQNNSSHKFRHINPTNSQTNLQKNNQLAYVKGQDFNPQQKYDFNTVTNE